MSLLIILCSVVDSIFYRNYFNVVTRFWNKNESSLFILLEGQIEVHRELPLTSLIHWEKYVSRLMTKQTKIACAPSEESDQPGHPSSPIRVFAVRMKKAWVLSYQLSAQRRLWSDSADAQADLSLRWAHSQFVGFVMRRLISFWRKSYAGRIFWRFTTHTCNVYKCAKQTLHDILRYTVGKRLIIYLLSILLKIQQKMKYWKAIS